MATERDQEEQDLRIDVMNATLKHIDFQIEQARREFAEQQEQWKRDEEEREAQRKRDDAQRKLDDARRTRDDERLAETFRRDFWRFSIQQGLTFIGLVIAVAAIYFHGR